MAHYFNIPIRARWLLLLLMTLVPAMTAHSVTRDRSDLSLWLTNEPLAALKQMLAEHPRFANQSILVQPGNTNGLTSAITTVLRANLQSVGSVKADTPFRQSEQLGKPASVDSLVCQAEAPEYRLQVSVAPLGQRSADVSLELIDGNDNVMVDYWRWHGRLSSAERSYIDRAPQSRGGNGQLSSPWQRDQITEAAAALTRDFVCSLRPWISGQTQLAWPGHSPVPNGALADTLRTSQHYIAAYNELALGMSSQEFEIETRAEPLSGDIWQLWITARPQIEGLPTIEAATYLMGSPYPGTASNTSNASTTNTARTSNKSRTAIPVYRADEREQDKRFDAPRTALHLEVLGVSKQISPRRADLVLRLRLSNTAQRELSYGLKTSGGYFAGCRGDSANYRHDAWGMTSGSLLAGESRITTIRVKNVLHQPSPGRGQSACAGFGDLAAFNDYPGHGHKITQYLRWAD